MAFEWTHKEPVHMVRGNIATTTFLSTFADWWDASFQTPDFSCLTFNSNIIQRRQKRRRWYKWIQDQTKQSIHPIFTVLLHFISFHEYQDETQKKIFVLRLLTQAYKKRSSFYLLHFISKKDLSRPIQQAYRTPCIDISLLEMPKASPSPIARQSIKHLPLPCTGDDKVYLSTQNGVDSSSSSSEHSKLSVFNLLVMLSQSTPFGISPDTFQ